MKQTIINKVNSISNRNLCYNSKLDNLNGWAKNSGTSKIEIDNEKFGYPVVKCTYGEGEFYTTGIVNTNGNNICPSIRNIQTLFPHPLPLNKDLYFSYDIYSTVDTTIRLNGDDDTDTIVIKPNKWTRIKYKINKGKTIYAFVIGYQDHAPINNDLYYKNVMINFGEDFQKYEYNNIIPESLEEQIVPNEFRLDKQVYQTTIDTNYGTEFTMGTEIFSGIPQVDWFDIVGGTVFLENEEYADIKDYCSFYIKSGSYDGSLRIVSINNRTPNKRMRYTIKYTKK